MSIMFVLLAKRAFSDVLEGVHSKSFSLPPLACVGHAFFYVNNGLNL